MADFAGLWQSCKKTLLAPVIWLKGSLMANPASPMQPREAILPSLLTRLKERLMANPAGPMQSWKAVVLFVYLVLFGGVMVYFVYGLWAADPHVSQLRAAPQCEDAPTPATDTPTPATDMPKIQFIHPENVTIGIRQASIRVCGDNFIDDSERLKVTFNGEPHRWQYVNEHQLVVPLESAAFAAPGAVAVQVMKDQEKSNAKILTVEAAGSMSGDWHVFGRRIPIRQDPRLILLVLFTGAFGACMSGLPSLADYLGERKLVESWFTFYLARPFVGGGIAFIFYLVIRGGFLAGTNFDATAVNPFGLAALAALVGMFSDKAILKLGEVFSTLFKAEDTRRDKLGQLAITTRRRLPDARVGIEYRQILEASGGTPPYTWAAITQLPAWLRLDSARGELSGTPSFESLFFDSPPIGSPPAPGPVAHYTFQVNVTDSAQASVTAELELTVRDA
jgi:Putative Ig domain